MCENGGSKLQSWLLVKVVLQEMSYLICLINLMSLNPHHWVKMDRVNCSMSKISEISLETPKALSPVSHSCSYSTKILKAPSLCPANGKDWGIVHDFLKLTAGRVKRWHVHMKNNDLELIGALQRMHINLLSRQCKNPSRLPGGDYRKESLGIVQVMWHTRWEEHSWWVGSISKHVLHQTLEVGWWI